LHEDARTTDSSDFAGNGTIARVTLQPQGHRFTIREYLELEAISVQRHEYFDGEIVAMAGGTPQHSLIIMNVGGELRQRLKGSSCRVYDSNLRVRVPGTSMYTYPDVTVICGEPRFDQQDPRNTTVVNPSVVIEVSSSSTAEYDRRDKFRQYLQLESLKQYVLIAQGAPFVESFFRRDDGNWLMTPYSELTTVFKLQALEVELPLSEIYAGIKFPDTPEALEPF
jgi:Uma2 family endonuclease